MGKGLKILGILLLVLAFGCFGMYFVMAGKTGNYKVVFDSDGGTTVQDQTVKRNEKVIRPDDPTKENSDFVEWQLNGVAYDFNAEVSSDITLKAIWDTYNMYNVNVTLDENSYSTSVREGKSLLVDALNIPLKDGYQVKLYNENGEEYDINSSVIADMVLTAKYIELKFYTVKFDSNGGTKVNDIKATEGFTIDEPLTTRDGYVFDGWYLGEEKYDFTTPVTKNITLKARWNDGVKYNVTFSVDGKIYQTLSVRENTKVNKPNNPEKKGYKFVEWQLEGKAFDFNTKITSDLTLAALFQESKTSKVTFVDDDGKTILTKEVTNGEKITKPTNPTKKGYKFTGWQLNGVSYDFNKEVLNDITLKAVFEKIYIVSFMDKDGKELSSKEVIAGEKVTKPADPVKDGSRFDGWLYNNTAFDFTTPITKDITLIARFVELKKYTVTFNSDGGSNISSQIVIEGNKANKPADPTRDNFKFAGWQLDGNAYDFNTAVNKDITLKAKWDLITSNPDVLEGQE